MIFSEVNVFKGISAKPREQVLWKEFIAANDFASGSVRSMVFDLRRFAKWFVETNKEPFDATRVTTSDISGFRDEMRRTRGLAVATVNHNLVTLRRYLGYLLEKGHININPGKVVKELHIQALAPKGLERPQVRKLLREVELRGDTRANAIFHLLLYTGCRVSDAVNLELQDLILNERSGYVIFKFGKGGKQRSCPLPLPARRALLAYLESRPPVDSEKVFIGERGSITDQGIRMLCYRYSTACGFKFFPHLLRHTFSKNYLEMNENDLVGLAQLLGHSNIQTTSRYCQRSADALAEAASRLLY
jgi:site-specific recombinase XerD